MNAMTAASIEADPVVPIIHITRDFAATPAQLIRANTDPALLASGEVDGATDGADG